MPPNWAHAQGDGDGGDSENADHHRTGHAASFQGDDDEEAEHGQQRAGRGEVAEADQGGRVVHHQTGFLEGDQGEEQADAGGDGRAQRQRNAVDDPLADTQHRQGEEQGGGNEHRAEGDLPAVAHVQDHGVGEEGVQAHAGGEGDGIVGDQTHHRRTDGGGQAGGDEHRPLVHAGLAEDGRVDEEDVGHGQEGGQTGQDFGAHRGVMRFELEQLFQHGDPPRTWQRQ